MITLWSQPDERIYWAALSLPSLKTVLRYGDVLASHYAGTFSPRLQVAWRVVTGFVFVTEADEDRADQQLWCPIPIVKESFFSSRTKTQRRCTNHISHLKSYHHHNGLVILFVRGLTRNWTIMKTCWLIVETRSLQVAQKSPQICYVSAGAHSLVSRLCIKQLTIWTPPIFEIIASQR